MYTNTRPCILVCTKSGKKKYSCMCIQLLVKRSIRVCLYKVW